MMSACGFTITVTVAVPVRALVALVPVTVKVNDCGAVRSGTIGAMKFCTEPSGAAGTRTIPAATAAASGAQVKVTAPPAGSTAVAVRVTGVPLATGLTGAELASTTGGAPAGGTTIGTITLA